MNGKEYTHGFSSPLRAEKTGPESEAPLTDANKQSGSSPARDLLFENHGSLFLIRPLSEFGQQWLDENVGDENTLTFGGAVVCEPRYVEAIYFGAKQDGLAVQA